MNRASFPALCRVLYHRSPAESGPIFSPFRRLSTAAESSGSGGKPAAKSSPSSSRNIKLTSESCVYHLD